MSRKHYDKIAKVLASEWHLAPSGDAAASVWRATLSMADVFAQDNDRFDRGRFYLAVFNTSDPLEARDIAFSLGFGGRS